MKVCTDSSILGAWVAANIGELLPEQILDIGTGTGLLSLMLAQKTKAHIYAVELDENAFLQANENFQSSPWAERLKSINTDIRDWTSPIQFDLIISNPPFYENDLLPLDLNKIKSKHNSTLSFTELIISVNKFLKKGGTFAVLLPFSRVDYFLAEAKKSGLFATQKLYIRQSGKHPYFRAVLLVEKAEKAIVESELSIKDEENNYTQEFVALLKDYYLNL